MKKAYTLIDWDYNPYYAHEALSRIWRTAKRYPVIGLDCEWSSIKKGVRRNCVALLQLSTIDGYTLLIRIQQILSVDDNRWNSFILLLDKILMCSWLLKVGVQIERDAQFLYDDYQLEVVHFLDLQHLAKFYEFPKTNLAYLAQRLCNFNMDKVYARMNWDADFLSPEALTYAANDAKYSILVFAAFFFMRKRDTKYSDRPVRTVRNMIQEWSDFIDVRYVHRPTRRY